jgi:hypothetical protein
MSDCLFAGSKVLTASQNQRRVVFIVLYCL